MGTILRWIKSVFLKGIPFPFGSAREFYGFIKINKNVSDLVLVEKLYCMSFGKISMGILSGLVEFVKSEIKRYKIERN